MKRWYAVILILLAAPLYIFGVFSLADKDATVSPLERRMLKTQPVLTSAALFHGSFATDYDAYFSDTFPLRDGFMRVNRALNGFYFFSGAGSDGMLVLSQDSQDTELGGESLDELKSHLGDLESTPTPTAPAAPAQTDTPASPTPSAAPAPQTPPELSNPDEKTAFDAGHSIILIGDRAMEIPSASAKLMTRYAETLSSMHTLMPDSRVFSLITPNAGEFYSPESFHTGKHSQKDMIDKTYSQMDSILTVDAYSALRAHTDEYIYFRTDHHWTARGAYYAYTALCGAAGFDPVALDAFKTGRYDTFLGSMYGWTSEYPQSKALKKNPDYLEYYLPVTPSSAEYFSTAAMTDGVKIPVVDTSISEDYSNKYLCFIRGDTPICRVTTENKNGLKCAVIKESYGNALIPFLTSHYEEIYVIDPRKFNSENSPAKLSLPAFVKDNEINDVLVVNYPFMINNKAYISMLEKLLAQ